MGQEKDMRDDNIIESQEKGKELDQKLEFTEEKLQRKEKELEKERENHHKEIERERENHHKEIEKYSSIQKQLEKAEKNTPELKPLIEVPNIHGEKRNLVFISNKQSVTLYSHE